MTTARNRKEKTLKDLLQKSTGPSTSQTANGLDSGEGDEAPATKAFMVELFSAIKEDIQDLHSQFSADLREVRRDLDGVGDRVATLEEHDLNRDEDIHQLQQDMIRL